MGFLDRKKLAEVERLVGYIFNDQGLLAVALGAVETTDTVSSDANELLLDRLEFLGDSLLQLAAARMLYNQNTEAGAGRLTRDRSNIVRNEMLARIGRGFRLDLYIAEASRCGVADVSDAHVADCLEALVGAIAEDRGDDEALAVSKRLLQKVMEEVVVNPYLFDPQQSLTRNLVRLIRTRPQFDVHRFGSGFRANVFIGDIVVADGYAWGPKAAIRSACTKALRALRDGAVSVPGLNPDDIESE